MLRSPPNAWGTASDQALRKAISLTDLASKAQEEASRDDSMKSLTAAVNAILPAPMSTEFMDLFRRHRERRRIDWRTVEPLPDHLLIHHEKIPRIPSDLPLRQALLSKIVVVKLNGGMGASMGCVGPKSALEARSGHTLLDLTVQQIASLNVKYGVDIPLILMNSFHTHQDTLKMIMKYSKRRVNIQCFEQAIYPRINMSHMLPLASEPFSMPSRDNWYPPGHGDVYSSLAACGLLDGLIHCENPKEYMFISNIDNLGATVDLDILQQLMGAEIECAMEVTPKTAQDVQGGVLVWHDDAPLLVELAEIPVDVIDEFHRGESKRFQHFNTNNLWVKLSALQRVLHAGPLDLEPVAITNTVNGHQTLQLETAAGSLVSLLPQAMAIRVPRSRFLPIKSTSDLLLLQSNLYQISNGLLQYHSDREEHIRPIVRLGPEFRLLADYRARMPSIPDLTNLRRLVVSGDVHFGNRVVLKGNVVIIADEGRRLDIPTGAVLEDVAVTGGLRIVTM